MIPQESQEWERAACRTAPRALFFPVARSRADDAVYATALAYCRRCPLQVECLQGARERQEPCGVWGGEIFDPPVPRRRWAK